MKLPVLLSFLSATVLLAQVPSAPPARPGTPAPPVPLPPAAGSPPAATVVEGGFEEPPVLKASEILQPQWLSGPHHKVRENVPTYAGENWYVIDSDAGTFEASGNVMLENRVREIYAILQLRQIVKSEVYGEALKNAAKSPFVMAKNLIENPVDTIAAVPKGVFKFIGRAGRTIENAATGRKKSEYEDQSAAAALGVSKAKRELAFQYGVNPYSSNSVLQKELNSMGWTSFAGKATIGVLTAGIGSGLGTTYSVAGVMGRNAARLRDTPPSELQMQNKAALMRMGASDAAAEQFFRNPALSPAHQTNMITALESMQGVTGRVDYAMLASNGVENETDANFFELTAQLIARVHAESMKLKAIEVVEGYPICVGENGSRIVAFHWDYAAWTTRAGDFLADLESKGTKLAVMITGQISPLLRQKLEAHKVQVFDPGDTGAFEVIDESRDGNGSHNKQRRDSRRVEGHDHAGTIFCRR